MKALPWLVILLLAGTFGLAGAIKLTDPAGFARDLENYRLIDPPLTAAIAVYLPCLELLTALGLLIPSWRGGAARIAVVLSSLFILALASAWWRDLDINCGCFGEILRSNLPAAMARAAAVDGMAIWLLWWERRGERTAYAARA